VIDFEVKVTADLSGLDRMEAVLRAPFGSGRGRRAVEVMRSSVASEFREHQWLTPDGGALRWKETLPFGDRPEKEPLGGPSGTLARAWAGGPSGFSTIDPQRAAIGISHPGAAMHRGGSGTDARERVTIVRPRKTGAKGLPSMFWYLGLTFGAWISPRRLERGLEIPSRPHATSNPKLEADLAAIVRSALGQ
jgi:phage gpG-like protein